MSDSISLLKKLGRAAPGEHTPHAEADEEACAAFGYLRGLREQALHLELRLADGNRPSFPYSWLGPVVYNPSRGLLLVFAGDRSYRVEVEGRNLDKEVAAGIDLVHRGVRRHRVVWLREMDPAETRRLPEHELAVERITVRLVNAPEDLYDPKRGW